MTKDSLEYFAGWGRSNGSVAVHRRATTIDEISELMTSSSAVIPRGLGRAYGDAAQCAGGTVIDCSELKEILSFDVTTGVVRVQAGCSINELSRYSVIRGWFIPVTPGTAYVTIGGALAADVHGKNHHREGSIASYVEEILLIAPDGSHLLSADKDPELFWATLGGMGLTGVIVEAALRLLPIESASISVDTDRAKDLDVCMELLALDDKRYRYSVAWVDAHASGRNLGRSVITCGDHAKLEDLEGRQRHAPLAYNSIQRLKVPFTPPFSTVNKLTLPVFNALWFRKSPRHRIGEIQPLNTYFYPLDMLGDWNRLYGPKGFTQYQFVVPFGHEDVVRYALERLQLAGSPSTLVVLKRFGESDLAPLSFPMPGWTLALDIPLGAPNLAEALDDLDRHVAQAGGRVYLAKDGRVRPELISTMYPRVDEFIAQCRRVDPNGLFASDLSRRLGLTKSPGAL